jgi:hypothetical protein
MRRTRRRVVASLLSLGVIASLVVSAPIAHAERRDDADRIDQAIAYLAAQQRDNGSIPAFSPLGSTADAVLAFVAAGVGEEQLAGALGFLRRRVAHGKADGVGITAKIVSAVVAGGGDPHAFGGVDLVQSLVDTIGPHGRFGTASVFDDALAVLALEAAGAAIPDTSIQWLVDAQCADGGWQYSKPVSANDDEHCLSTVRPTKDYFQSDTNTTSYVIQAVDAAGDATFAEDPFAFFDAIRDAKRHGWGYTWGFQTTDANSTALVIQAFAAAGTPVPADALTALRKLQDPACGGWSFTWTGTHRTDPDPGSTIGAVLGLLQQPLPVPAGAAIGAAAPVPACG